MDAQDPAALHEFVRRHHVHYATRRAPAPGRGEDRCLGDLEERLAAAGVARG